MNYPNKKSMEDTDVVGKRVLVHCDFNIPFNSGGNISDSGRIDEALKTIRYLIDHHAKVILCSHLSRSKGEFNPKYSSALMAEHLSKVLGQLVQMVKGVIGDNAKAIYASLKEGEVALLENVRFHKEEEKNDPEFSRAPVSLAEIYVNDALSTAYRAHASTVGMTAYLPAVCGCLIQKEITVMGNALANPERPFIVILGGAKVSDRIGVISNLLDKVDALIIDDGMTYTFMKVLSYFIGTPICEGDELDFAQGTMVKAKEKNVKSPIPLDNVVTDKYDEDVNHHVTDSDQIPNGWMGLDTGLKTQELFISALRDAGMVVWNGPMGASEWENFAAGTVAAAKTVAESGVVFIIGGGDSAAAVEQLGFADKMTHISTGGGASLELPEDLELPGIVCLNDKN